MTAGGRRSRPSSFSTAEEIVSNRARREQYSPALGWREQMILFGRFADIVAARAVTIAAMVRPGEVVALIMSDTPGAVSTTLAVWRASCTAAPLDPRLPPEELARRIAHSGCAAVIAHQEHVERAEEAIRAAGCDAILLVSRGLRLEAAGRPGRAGSRIGRGKAKLAALPRRRSAPAPAGSTGGLNDVAFHAYTGGAGEPLRAAVLTHANVVASALRVSVGRGDGPEDVALATHPIHDVGAFVADILSRLISGGAVVLLGPENVASLVHQIEQHRVTDVSLSSGLADRLVEGSGPPRRAIRSVRKVTIRDSALSLTLKRGIADRFPTAELIQSYGRVETTGGFLMARQGAVFRKPDTLGVPHPGLVVAILGDDGREERPGRRGEIVCRGAVVMRGYHGAPRATRETLRDGWLRTGDLGYIDSDGEISLVGGRGRGGARS